MSTGRAYRRLVRASAALYRTALWRYPAAFRRRYGPSMVEDFERLLEDEVRRKGIRGWARTCARVGRDLVRPLPRGVGVTSPPSRHPPGSDGTHALVRVTDDVRAAWRSLRRNPRFTLLVVGVSGAGIALNAAMFAVVDAYLLRPLPYPAAERIVQPRPASAAIGWTNSDDVFEAAVSWQREGFTLVGDPAPEVVLGARVTPDYFDLYGVHPELGRAFGSAKGGEGAAAVALISHHLWETRFSADPGILGRTVRVYASDVGGTLESFTVIGVLPAGFSPLDRYTELLVPLRAPGPLYVGRLRPDVPPERAVEILTERARAAGALPGEEGPLRLPRLQDAYTASIRPQLVALQAAALLALLTACVNAGLLLLVRANGRRREMGVRRALGAGRRRLAGQLFGEGALLALLSGLLGIALGRAALEALGTVIQARLGRAVPGGAAMLHLDGSVLTAVLVAVAVMACVLGSVPMWTAVRQSLARRVDAGGRWATGPVGGRRASSVLIAVEVALSLTLLSGGALLVRSTLHLQGVELGFSPERLEAYTVGLTSDGAESVARRIAFFGELERRADQLPGVASAALARAAPFAGALVTRRIEGEGEGPAAALPEAVPQIASPAFFDILGARAERGRLLTPDDDSGSEAVAVVSAALAESLRPGGDVLGTRVRFPRWTMPTMSEEPGPWMRVVGVVPDVADGLTGARPTVYVPYLQAPSAWMELLLRRRPGAPPLASQVKALVRDLDADTPVYGTADIPRAVHEARAPSRFFAGLVGGFSLFALALAIVGLHGVATHAARQRRRDVAVRMALGARRGAVEALFLRQSRLTLGAGLAAGLLGGRLLGRALEGQLYGVRADDAPTALAAGVLVAATALVSLWLPARRATRADVSAILRED